jgi:guanylate kinase
MSPAPQKLSFPEEEGIALVLSAPSGTGKTTLCHRLTELLPDIKFSISHTTRSPREGEIDGEDYFFVSEKEFNEMKERGDFLEWAKIYNHLYGTAYQSVKNSHKKGQDFILELDVQGAKSLHALNYPGVFVFILPPSLEELAARLKNRATESDEKINQRLETGLKEIKQCLSYDYILTNRDIEETVGNLISIIKAEKCRASRFTPPAKDIQSLLDSKEG